ncbi:MAG: inorganic phosphate transporter [Clostridiales bacterium]|nr:inorganic phosphate transporter [Clostridiales bacterium]
MFSTSSMFLIFIIVLTLLFDFINGFHDTANSIATSVSTRVLSPKQAIAMATILNFVGALISSKVAKTISAGLIKSGAANGQYAIIATLIAAIIWNLITWHFAIPSSSSHAMIGGLIGSSMVFARSVDVVNWIGYGGVVQKVIIPLFIAPLLGLFIGYLLMSILYEVLRPFTQAFVNRWFSKFQIISAAFVAYSHGSNDAQKSMGIITLALISTGILGPDADVPLWVKCACAIAMALGTSIGGWKIMKTMGLSMIKLQPIGGFAAQTGAAVIIETMSHFGAPVSTTQVITTSVLGVGAAKRASAVRWGVVREIVIAWIITLPLTALMGAGIAYLMQMFV